METMETALARILTQTQPLALHSIDKVGTETLQNSIQHTTGPQDVLSLQQEWGWMETMETALTHIST